MVDVNGAFCDAVENEQNKTVCETLERLKGIDVMEVPIVLAEPHGMKIVAEQGIMGGENVSVYSNADFQKEFEGQKVVTYDEYKGARDFVSENRSNPQMTGTGISQLGYMEQRIDYLDKNYMNDVGAEVKPEVSPMGLTH